MNPLRVYIGYDPREHTAYRVAESSLRRHATAPVSVTPLVLSRFEDSGLLHRPTDLRGARYDIPSNAPATTEFSISRFLVPTLAHTGWALFADCDVVFQEDIAKLFECADPNYAVMCVKHGTVTVGAPKTMGAQTGYYRKLWSSVMLINCDHPANRRLSIDDINRRPGRDLHAFYWLADREIGALPEEWNYLVGIDAPRPRQSLYHFTLGTPDTGSNPQPDDRVWWEAHAHLDVSHAQPTTEAA